MGRPHGSTEKLPSRRGIWDDNYEEDTHKSGYFSRTKTGNWTTISKKTGMGRVERSSRGRWSNRSRHDDVDHHHQDSFTPQEEELVIKLHATIGSRWNIIAQQLPGRTDNDVKNLWNTKLKKKLHAMGIDPVTHKPFSQVLADYGSIGGFPTANSNTRSQFGTLNRALKTTAIISRTHNNNENNTNSKTTADDEPSSNGDCFVHETNKNEVVVTDLNHQYQYIDLLSELQAIKSITESANYSAPDPIVSPPSSLSSSSSLTSPLATSNCQEMSCSGFNWCDFLLEDAFLPADSIVQEHNTTQEHHQNNNFSLSSTSSSNNVEAVAASSSSSFVEAMLSREDDMFLDFPCLSEEPFYY